MKRKRESIFKAGYVIGLLIISVAAFMWYSHKLKDELRGLVRNTLKEVSNQNVLVMQKEIEGDLAALEEIAERISAMGETDEGEILDVLRRIEERYSFKRFGFCRADGIVHTTVDEMADVSEREYFRASMQGESYISDPLIDIMDGEEIIVFSAPIKSDGEVIGVLCAPYRMDGLKEILEVSSFEGEGYTYVIERDGDKIVDSTHPTSFRNMTNIFKSMTEADERNDQAVEDLKLLLDAGQTGYVIFYNKVGKYMYATPLGIKDWFLIDVVPVDFMENTSNYIINRTYIMCGILAVVCAVIAFLIMSEERRKKQRIQNLLYVDELTGGNTLARFKIEVERRMQVHYKKLAIIMMDLDDFKLVNELFGYEEGNKVLRFLSRMLKESCCDGEFTGRSNADRFYILFLYEEEKEIKQRILKLAENIQRLRMSETMEYLLHPVFGIYYVKAGDDNVEDMMDCAALAHNMAKQARNSTYKVYTDEIKEKELQKKQLSDQIEHAYRNHEFIVYYQPKYDSITRKLAGAEALVRWRRADGQMVSPGLFVPLAEESGFVCKLDEYVFREVCLAQKRWMDKGLDIVPVSVNLSRRHLDNPEFINEYKAILDESGVPIEYIQLEITESAMFEKKEDFVQIMERLHDLGFMILMDDFGTGYSSLMMLKSIPIDVMKLDKSFVDDYDDERGERIIRCVMRMAQDLSIAITAEGVETEAQYRFLTSVGCDTIQGYYFARPMPEEEYELRMQA
ncbi:MAG: EAL domain-containing protein [Lachnospiraceae bacterium]|nr:EAL domain-containing protein [Lachnospiraceae bacterium]